MANNHGAYDPRQFLHYPEKDPFSDAAQRRLDQLIKDFLNTGIAFVNGAGVRDINIEHRKGGGGLSDRAYDDAMVGQEHEAHGNATVNATGDDEDEEFESQFSRLDKGKGRDEREGPGLKGLWTSAIQFSPGTSPPGASVTDAASFLTDNGSLELEGSEMELGDRDGFFEEVYENEDNEEAEVDEEEESHHNSGLVASHSRSPGSEQEIIYIGDSDEEEDPREAVSDLESDGPFRNESKWARRGIHDDDHAPGADWGSASEFEEVKEERQESDDAWNYSISRQDEDDNAEEPERHQSQGKESDDDDRGCIAGRGDLEEDGRNNDDSSHSPIQPRRFFPSASSTDPWKNWSNAVAKIGSPVLFPADWGASSLQHHVVDRQAGVVDGTEDIRIASFEPARDDLDPEITDDTEANEHGPPPELQSGGHVEDRPFSFTNQKSDLTRMVYLQPIPEPDASLPEHGIQSLESSGLSSGASAIDVGHSVNTSYADPPAEPSVSRNLGSADRAFLSSPSAPGLQLDPDVFQVASITPGYAVHGALESTSVGESTPAGLGHTSKVPAEHSAVTATLTESFLRTTPKERSDSQEPVSFADTVEKTHDVDECQGLTTPTPPDDIVPVELAPFQEPDAPADSLVSQAFELLTQSSPFAEEDSNEDIPKQVLLHPAVFDDQEPTHTEAQLQSPTPAILTGYTDDDVEIYDTVEGMTGDEVIVARGVSEHADDDDAHDAHYALPETLDTEEVLALHAGDVVFSQYVVSEVMSEVSAARTGTASPPAALEGVQRCGSEGAIPSISAPTVSVGSNTPPLSPTATVTNSSSAPDPSVATSDLSTVNQASVSVVTSTGSPPPIHVSRVFATHADIRQPVLTHVGYASDEDHTSGDGVSVLPDPRLPPEPTHLGIPMGVVGRSLRDDKEERAESMKVEPPRSESESGSMVGEARNVCEAEEVRESIKDAVQNQKSERVAEDEGVSASPADREVVVSADVPILNGEGQEQKDGVIDDPTDEATDELVYPESGSDHLSTDGGQKPVLQAPGGAYTHSTDMERILSRSPSATPKASIDISNSATDDVGNVAIPSTEVLAEPPTEDATDHQVNGNHTELNGGTDTLIYKQNGAGMEHLSRSSPDDGQNASDNANSRSTPSIPSRRASTSPAKSRKSTRGKTKTKTVEDRSVSPPPPSQSIISPPKRSPALRKRRRASYLLPESSKRPRLNLPAIANKPSSLDRGATSTPEALDDKSDVSSVTSSSSAVSQLLVQRGTSSSPSILSQSPSIILPQSPTPADDVFMIRSPIRKYVPHKHNTSPVPPRHTSVERVSSVQAKYSVSPSPTSPSAPSLTPLSPTHQTRASCTDHKISIPSPEGLLYFLVPRCSLLDPEVVKDVNIVDCGVATRDEIDRAIGDLEAINLNSITLGVIRQLAGIQLMREGQVGYLPQPGEPSRQRVKHGRSHIHNTHDGSLKVDPNFSSRPGSSRMASLGIESAPSPISFSGSALSDITENEKDSPRTRSKVSQADDEAYETSSEDEVAPNVEEDSYTPALLLKLSPKSVRSPRVTVSRRRKLRPEDAAYKPEIEAAESSSDSESLGGKKRSRRASKRKTNEMFAPGDSMAGNLGTPSPKKKRKRKDGDQLDNFDGPLGSSETRRKKARRKKDRHAGDHVATAI